MPFLLIKRIEIGMNPIEGGIHKNTLDIRIDFALEQNPFTLESVDFQVG